MLKQFSDKVEQGHLVESLARLSRDNSFRLFRQWLEHNLKHEDHAGRWMTDANLRIQCQGRQQVLEEILDVMKER